MTVQASVGAQLFLAPAAPTTYDFPGFAAPTFTPIAELLDIGEFGNVLGFAEHSPLKQGITKPVPGFETRPEFPITMGHSVGDAGQEMLATYAGPTGIRQTLSFKVVLDNGEIMLFTGYLSGLNTSIPGGNSIVGATANLRMKGRVLRLDPMQAAIWSIFEGGGAGFYSSVDPKYKRAYTTYNGSALAVSPGDPVGRVESLAGGLTLSQPASPLRPVLGRYPEGGIRNRVDNQMTGGTDGSPGIAPFGWILTTSQNSVVRTLTYYTDTDGARVMRIRYAGTPDSSSGAVVIFSETTATPATSGQQWSVITSIKLAPGSSFSGITGAGLLLNQRDAGGALLTSETSDVSDATEAWDTRAVSTTLANGSTVYVTGQLRFDYAVGVPIDLTVDIKLMQLEHAAAPTAVQRRMTAYDITEPGKREIWSIYGNGTQWMTFGTDQFGSATLFAGAGQEWVSVPSFVTFSGTAMALVSATDEASSPDQKFWQGIGLTTPFVPRSVLRGATTSNPWGSPVIGGAPYLHTLRWDGASATGWQPVGGTEFSPAVGTAVDEAVSITFMVRNAGGPNIYAGFAMPFLLDSAPSDPEMTTLRTALMEEAGA